MNTLLPLGIGFGFLTFFALQKRAEKLAQPARLEMADIGRELLARDDLSDDARHQVQLMLKTAFGMHWLIMLGYLVVPFLVPLMAVAPEIMERIAGSAWVGAPAEVRAANSRLDKLHTRVSFANHPVMMSLLCVEIIIVTIPSVIIAIALPRRRGLPDVTDTDNLLTSVASHATRFGLGLAYA